MNRKAILSIGVLLCAAVLVLAVIWGLKLIPGGFAHADSYTAGNAEITAQVKNLDIEWTSGKIVFATHSGSTVLLNETCDKPLAEDEKMQWWLDGNTLRVRYEKPAIRLFSAGKKKVLTVTLPEGIALDDARISATSADMSIPMLRAENLTVNITSGNVNAVAAARKANVGSTSGDITLILTGPVESLIAGSTSGSLDLTVSEAGKVAASSTSGAVSLKGTKCGDVDLGSTSGNVYVEVEEAGHIVLHSTSGSIRVSAGKFASLKSDSTSGSVQAFLPAEPGFTARLSTTSGRVEYTLPLTKQGGSYICGDGSARVDIGTTSGSITVKDIAESIGIR